MIAIVGAKGGCGKTTTTLGLARALARSGRSVVAVDADRQLPNLHVVGGVEREPTLAALETGSDVDDLAQRPSDDEDVGVVPAPIEPESVDFPRQLRRLGHAPARILLDCPSGAGPDVCEPLRIADGAVVVTTPTERSAAAAAKTVDLARALSVPVVGVIVTRATTVPPTVRELVDATVIGTVPAARSPLSVESVTDAYDAAAKTLEAKSYQERCTTTPNRMADRLETGIDVLDRKLDGGVPPGCLVAYTAEPASQSELLLYELTAARRTLYLSTHRSDEAVRHALESSMTRVGSPTVRRIQSEDPIEEVTRLIGAIPNRANLIIDCMDALEQANRNRYVSFLNRLKERMIATESVAIFHCLKGQTVPQNRSMTEHVADAVFDLRTTVSATELENHLTIPKYRRGGAPTEAIKLELSERVEIDTSRDIA